MQKISELKYSDIFQISKIEDFNIIYNQLKSNNDFKILNSQTPSKGKYNFSSALNHYGEYLKNIKYEKYIEKIIKPIEHNKYENELKIIENHFNFMLYDKVLEECEKLTTKIKEDSTRVYILFLQGLCYYKKGQKFYSKSEEFYERALKIDENDNYSE